MQGRCFALLSIIVLDSLLPKVSGQSNGTECKPVSVVGYSSSQSCTLLKMQTNPLRVVFLDKLYVTQNFPAIAKAKQLGIQYIAGQTCERAATAMPEW